MRFLSLIKYELSRFFFNSKANKAGFFRFAKRRFFNIEASMIRSEKQDAIGFLDEGFKGVVCGPRDMPVKLELRTFSHVGCH